MYTRYNRKKIKTINISELQYLHLLKKFTQAAEEVLKLVFRLVATLFCFNIIFKDLLITLPRDNNIVGIVKKEQSNYCLKVIINFNQRNNQILSF